MAVGDVAAPRLQEELDNERRLVDVDHFDVTVRELVRMSAEGEIRRAPEYQRKFRWDEETESRLIESIMLGLPVPALFMATNVDGTWEVVDGLQRLSSLMHFLLNDVDVLSELGKTKPLVLRGLEKLGSFNGRSFEDLPVPIQLLFGKRGLRVTALSDKSNLEARFQVFERLNTGGVALSAQEVRACIFQGRFNDFIRRLAGQPSFTQLLKLQKQHQHDATREELVLKFFAYLYRQDYFEGAVGEFLTQYMDDVHAGREPFDYELNSDLFDRVTTELLRVSGGPVIRRSYKLTPLNQFEAVMVAAGRLLTEHPTLGSPGREWLDDEELVASSTKGTNTKAMLRRRIDRARVLLAP